MEIVLNIAQEQTIIAQLLEKVHVLIPQYVKENMVPAIRDLANQDDSIFDTTAFSPSTLGPLEDDHQHASNNISQINLKIEELETKLSDCLKKYTSATKKCKVIDSVLNEQQHHIAKKAKDFKSSVSSLQKQLNAVKDDEERLSSIETQVNSLSPKLDILDTLLESNDIHVIKLKNIELERKVRELSNFNTARSIAEQDTLVAGDRISSIELEQKKKLLDDQLQQLADFNLAIEISEQDSLANPVKQQLEALQKEQQKLHDLIDAQDAQGRKGTLEFKNIPFEYDRYGNEDTTKIVLGFLARLR